MKSLLAGVVGWPVAHSLSPRMHSFWLREHAINGAYVAFPVQRHDLSGVLASLGNAGFLGVNLTVPHKEAAFALAHTADDAARAAGAANLLLFRDGRYAAFNTDIEGLTRSLLERLANAAAARRVLILGAGGAARAAVLACDKLNVERICVLNRTRIRADALRQALRGATKAAVVVVPWDDWEKIAPQTDLLINATSAGLNGTPSPNIPLNLLPSDAAVCDLIYNPIETSLLATARARGIATVDGLGMLMHQGAGAFELLFGVRPTVSLALRCELMKALRDGA